jgi:hypothetical protein
VRPQEPDWMPVFVLIERRRGAQAAHPDHKAPLPPTCNEDVMQRIGTAHRDADGTYIIKLTVLPLSGQLLMRPPRPDESPNVTQKEQR